MPGRLEQAAEKKPLEDAEKALQECTAVEAELAELRAAYEQYFLGVERHPPAARHEALKRRVVALKSVFLRQTAVKFRVQSLAARLMTFERLWDRSLKEIEAGTYRRDLNRAKRHQKQKEQPKKPELAAPGAEDLDLSDLDDVVGAAPVEPPRPSKPSPAPAAVVAPPSVQPAMPQVTPAVAKRPVVTPAIPAVAQKPAFDPAGGLTEQKIKAIYDAYLMAKRRCGEDTKGLTLDSVASSLKKQVPELMRQHQAKSVEFKVVIKDGRAVLRALPRD